MLPQVVKTREASGAMALEGSFTRMFTGGHVRKVE